MTNQHMSRASAANRGAFLARNREIGAGKATRRENGHHDLRCKRTRGFGTYQQAHLVLQAAILFDLLDLLGFLLCSGGTCGSTYPVLCSDAIMSAQCSCFVSRLPGRRLSSRAGRKVFVGANEEHREIKGNTYTRHVGTPLQQSDRVRERKGGRAGISTLAI